MGGKDSASPRYIFTCLDRLAYKIFNPLDTPILNHQTEEQMDIEPEFYVPILPMILINGSKGIGTIGIQRHHVITKGYYSKYQGYN